MTDLGKADSFLRQTQDRRLARDDRGRGRGVQTLFFVPQAPVFATSDGCSHRGYFLVSSILIQKWGILIEGGCC